ncbi:hypothetical protein VP01_400g2 [Puccinia sorghi]|uniref:Uncharacterized protein n=1 Tax=Puccinia sorghi TaxID=27349 RepID=A0A0L6URV2_9BASI|nr:hypothetical protein VP01_400g2 [Puccinia sorghi]
MGTSTVAQEASGQRIRSGGRDIREWLRRRNGGLDGGNLSRSGLAMTIHKRLTAFHGNGGVGAVQTPRMRAWDNGREASEAQIARSAQGSRQIQQRARGRLNPRGTRNDSMIVDEVECPALGQGEAAPTDLTARPLRRRRLIADRRLLLQRMGRTAIQGVRAQWLVNGMSGSSRSLKHRRGLHERHHPRHNRLYLRHLRLQTSNAIPRRRTGLLRRRRGCSGGVSCQRRVVVIRLSRWHGLLSGRVHPASWQRKGYARRCGRDKRGGIGGMRGGKVTGSVDSEPVMVRQLDEEEYQGQQDVGELSELFCGIYNVKNQGNQGAGTGQGHARVC